jgi:hypothetical protein
VGACAGGDVWPGDGRDEETRGAVGVRQLTPRLKRSSTCRVDQEEEGMIIIRQRAAIVVEIAASGDNV